MSTLPAIAGFAPVLAAAHRIIAPPAAVLAEARIRGYDTAAWQVVPDPLLAILANPSDRAWRAEQFRRQGPVRIVARLGAERASPACWLRLPRDQAGAGGGWRQQALLGECQALATTAGARLRPALTWQEVSPFLAGAAVTIIPLARETFGNLALQSLSAGTPVVAYATGNLPALLDGTGAGVLIPAAAGPRSLWRATRDLLADPVRYRQACGAAYCRSRNYRSADIADAFLKAVW